MTCIFGCTILSIPGNKVFVQCLSDFLMYPAFHIHCTHLSTGTRSAMPFYHNILTAYLHFSGSLKPVPACKTFMLSVIFFLAYALSSITQALIQQAYVKGSPSSSTPIGRFMNPSSGSAGCLTPDCPAPACPAAALP